MDDRPGGERDTMGIVIVAAFAFSVIILVLCITYYITTYNHLSQCENEPNFWCFNDWTCNTTGPDQFPAKNLYCNPGSSPTDFDYCNRPENADRPACKCNLAPNGGTCIPAACTCQWQVNAPGGLGVCGQKFCSAGQVRHCAPGS